MKAYKKICIGICISAVSLTVLYYSALISIPSVIDLNKYKQTVSKEIEQQTGFKISCEDIRFKRSLTPYLKIDMHHTIVLYPDNNIFLKIKAARINVKIIPLIFKKIIIKNAQLTRPIVNITIYPDLSTSIEKYYKQNTIKTGNYNFDSIIYDTILKNYKLKITDKTINKLFTLEGDKILVKDVKINERMHIILDGVLKGDEKEYLNYNLDIISGFDNEKKQFTFSPFKPIVEYDVKGNIDGKLEIAANQLLKGNLNLNNISVNIDNTILKNNKASFIFKGEEVDIDANIHTSNKDNSKIKGKYSFGKKKYIDIKAEAKNANLENLHKVISIVSKSLNIPSPINNIKVKGLLNADFTINSDFKKLKSKGNAQIINAEVIHDSLPYKINKINSNINFDNNKIIIEKAQAYVNSTPVNITGNINEDVTVDIKAQSNNLDLKTIINLFLEKESLPVNILKGKLSFECDIKGKFNNSVSMENAITIDDLAFVEKINKIPFSISKTIINAKNNKNKINGEIICSDVKSTINKKNISANEFKLNFNEKTVQIPKNTINIISSPVQISGTINDYMNIPTGQISFNGDIKAQNLADVISDYIKEPYKAQGIIKTDGLISFSGKTGKIKTQMFSDKNNYLSYIVIKELLNKPSMLNLEAEFNNEQLNIKDLSLKENNTNKTEPQIKISGAIKNEKEPVLNNVHIIIPKQVTVSTNFFGGEQISLNTDINLNNTIKNPSIKGNARVFKYQINKLNTLIRNADINFSNNNIRLVAPDVNVNGSLFNITADIEPKFEKTITVSDAHVNSLNLDLNTMFNLIQNQRNPFGNNLLTIKKGSATINNFRVLDLKSKDISSDFTLKDNNLKIERISATAYMGKIAGDISYNFNNSAVEIKLIGKGLDIKDSLYDLCKIKDNLAGRADFTSSISLYAGEYNQTLKSLSGKLTFNAVNGRMGTLGKFEYYLNAQNVLYHGLLNTTLNRLVDAISPQNTANYKTAQGALSFRDGYMITDEIKTKGQNMSLLIKGRHNLLTNQANIDIYGRISDDIKTRLGSFANVSLSELINGQESKKNVSIMAIPSSLMNEIPELYRKQTGKTNTFKVNICGNVNSISSINSFMWTVERNEERNKLPEFSDILKNDNN